eukprot:2237706-Prymnesium_polylepis.2
MDYVTPDRERIGDLSYADGYISRWDSYARMMEPLSAVIPVMTAGGNHELSSGEAWLSYNVRYPMPYRAAGSLSNLWWSRDVGPIHVIALCTYAATAANSLQHRWLRRDLAAVDRAQTPWLVVMMHAPWYNSNHGHRDEAELMRQDMEVRAPLHHPPTMEAALTRSMDLAPDYPCAGAPLRPRRRHRALRSRARVRAHASSFPRLPR